MATVPASLSKMSTSAPEWAAARATTSRRYLVCVGLLLATAVGIPWAASALGLALRKLPVPLKSPLHSFDWAALNSRYVLDRVRTGLIPPMSEDMIDSLGTEEYLQAYLTDTTRPHKDPTRTALVMVTYYTGQPDMVPHVAEECWRAAGKEQKSDETVKVMAEGIGAVGNRVPVRVQEYESRGRAGNSVVDTVLYFFHVNGHYETTRNGVRARLTNPFQSYAYYAKIEVTFNDGSEVRASKDESIRALGPLLERLMPVLFEKHFDLERFGPAAGSAGPTPPER